MPIRVINGCEKNIQDTNTDPIVVVDSTPTTVLPNLLAGQGEFAGRQIQNVGANDCYFKFGADCNPLNFNGILAKSATLNGNGHGSGQQLDCSNGGYSVSVYSIGGTTISVIQLARRDNAQGSGGILTSAI
jgi:hypothetical protein